MQSKLKMAHARYYLLCAGSGLAWSGIAYLLLGEWFLGLWVGIAVSPLFGLLVGWSHRPSYRFPMVARVLVALATLYVAAVLFGLVIGVVQEVIETSPNHVRGASIIEWVLVTVYGVTFTGYFLFLWPMAFLNHWLLGRTWKGEWARNDSWKAVLFICCGVGVGGLVAALLWHGGAGGN